MKQSYDRNQSQKPLHIVSAWSASHQCCDFTNLPIFVLVFNTRTASKIRASRVFPRNYLPQTVVLINSCTPTVSNSFFQSLCRISNVNSRIISINILLGNSAILVILIRIMFFLKAIDP